MKSQKLKNGLEIIIRPAELEDAQGLLDYTITIFENDEFFITTLDDIKDKLTLEKSRERIGKHRDKSGNIFLIAECDGVIVGVIEFSNGEKKRTEHVGNIGLNVLKEYRGNGIGTAMTQALIEWAKNDEVIEKLSLGVFASNHRAISLYEKLGFVEEGRRLKEVKMDSGKYIDVILMCMFV